MKRLRNKKGRFANKNNLNPEDLYEGLCEKGLRRCSDCRRIFKLNNNNFYKNKGCSTGYDHRCKECVRLHGLSPRIKYYQYEYSAERRGIEFDITYKEFLEYWGKECYYCGDKIKTIGLDRIDNSEGYIRNNIMSSCYKCNKLKGTSDGKEFIKRCRKIAKKNG